MRSLIGGVVDTLRNQATPVAYTGRGGFPVPFVGTGNVESQMRAMGSVGTLFAIVHRITNAVSQVDWHMHRESPGSTCDVEGCEEQDVTHVRMHAALDLWTKPNPFYTRQELVEATQQHLDLTGEGWLVVGRDPRAPALPLTLWPVRPDRMSPVPNAKDFLSGYVYIGPDGEKIPLDLNEVMMLRMPNPLDPYRGMGPVQAIMVDTDSERYSAQWNRNFFLNSAEPGGIIEIDKRLGDDEFRELRDRWNEQHRGVAAAHRVAILEQGKWVDRKFTMRDMQFAELRTLSREIIREAFGFPKPMLGAVDDVNRANAEAGEVVFARWLLISRLERWKGMLNNDLLPLYGQSTRGLSFVYMNPVPPDREADNNELTAKANAAAALAGAGYDLAGTLEAVGLPPIKAAPKPEPLPMQLPGPVPDEEPANRLMVEMFYTMLNQLTGQQLSQPSILDLAASRAAIESPPFELSTTRTTRTGRGSRGRKHLTD